jgi:hypothetical protein
MATEWQKEQARKKARAAGKVPASDKKLLNIVDESKLGKGADVSNKGRTKRQRELDEIEEYNRKYRKGKKKDTRPLSSLGGYGKKDSTATSGGSKAVRKVTGESLVERLQKKPFKYLK